MKITSIVRPSQLLHSERVYQEAFMCEVGDILGQEYNYYFLWTDSACWVQVLLLSVDNLRLKFSLNIKFSKFKA